MSWLHPNPYCERGKWYWYNESYDVAGPYDTAEEANRQLLRYCAYIEGGPLYRFGEDRYGTPPDLPRHMNWDRRPASAFRRLTRFFHNRIRRIAP